MINSIRLLLGLLPHSIVKTSLLNLTGYRIHRTARVSTMIIWRVQVFQVGPYAHVGPLNVFRDLVRVRMGVSSVLGQWNWVSSAPALADQQPTAGILDIGKHSAITSRHYLDASGGIEIGDFSTIAGVRSTFLTHGIKWKSNHQVASPISIGSYCMIGSNCVVAPGTRIADRTVAGMGTTIAGVFDQENTLLVQPRANVGKEHLTGAYFSRKVGYVD